MEPCRSEKAECISRRSRRELIEYEANQFITRVGRIGGALAPFYRPPNRGLNPTASSRFTHGRGGSRVIESSACLSAWPTLPEPIRRAMLALIG
jgi:hypothetical protein